jgi:hypothetical protein
MNIVGRNMSDKNLEQWINKFCVKISETLLLLTLAYGEYAMKKYSVAHAVQGRVRNCAR